MRVKDRLAQLGVRPTRARGQNFLIDQAALAAIVASGECVSGERLIEIGPGLGALTERLMPLGLRAVIEVDRTLATAVQQRWHELTVVVDDVRAVEFTQFGERLVVFGNLPYSLSTDIVFHLAQQRNSIDRAVLLLQREFVERMAAQPGGRDYGVLSIMLQRVFDISAGLLVAGDAFHPPTEVESRVVVLRTRAEDLVSVRDEVWFQRVVRAAFSQRRKKIINGLAALSLSTRTLAIQACEQVGIDQNQRPERLSIAEFARLSDRLLELCHAQRDA